MSATAQGKSATGSAPSLFTPASVPMPTPITPGQARIVSPVPEPLPTPPEPEEI